MDTSSSTYHPKCGHIFFVTQCMYTINFFIQNSTFISVLQSI